MSGCLLWRKHTSSYHFTNRQITHNCSSQEGQVPHWASHHFTLPTQVLKLLRGNACPQMAFFLSASRPWWKNFLSYVTTTIIGFSEELHHGGNCILWSLNFIKCLIETLCPGVRGKLIKRRSPKQSATNGVGIEELIEYTILQQMCIYSVRM